MRPTRLSLALALLAGTASLLLAHDLFLKLDDYFPQPNTRVLVPVLNGTFSSSEADVAPDRIVDISLVTPAGRARVGSDAWSARNDTSFLALETGAPGTYVVGVSTRTRDFSLDAESFNQYLEHDGIPDVLEARRRDNELDRDVVERYAKHVKALFQVGDVRTDAYATPLGYPAEIVPLENPYSLGVGSELSVVSLVDGGPVGNQLVIAGGEGAEGTIPERSTRTDAEGIARFVLDTPGKWYVKFIHMVPSPEEGIDYESKWATLTFAVR
jgi:hypothetical protein